MDRVYNGMCAGDLGAEDWRKPWSGGNGGSCVEAKKLNDGRVALRQSTDPDGPALIYTRHEISSFILGAKAGQADFLLPRQFKTLPAPFPPREHGTEEHSLRTARYAEHPSPGPSAVPLTDEP